MLNKDVRDVLKNLVQVNNSMVIEDTMHFCDEFKSIVGRANLKLLDSSLETFGIFDVSSFLGSVELLDDPKIELDGNVIVCTDNDSTLRFITSDVSSLEDSSPNPKIIDTTTAVESIFEFNLTTELLSKIKKASGVFRTFDTLYLIKDAAGASLKMGTKETFSKSNNSFSTRVDGIVDKGNEFSIALPIDSVLKIPAMDYTFRVKYNQAKDSYRVVLDNTLLTLVMSLVK
jgi:hypothetical protein